MPWWDDYPSTGPIRVDNGLKSRSARGDIATTWWSRRFIAVLEDMKLGGRLSRGRTYARAGQVLWLTVESGRVTAEVQGSRAQPYDVELVVRPFDDGQWDRIVAEFADRALYAAKLLAGQMPDEIEEAFAGLRLPLFPKSARDLPMRCTCPDWAVPCKHLAAVCYLLAERFDEDPFLIFQWRGRTKDELLERLRERRGTGGSEGAGDERPDAAPSAFPGAELIVVDEQPLADRVEDFYLPGPELSVPYHASRPARPDLLLHELEAPGISVGRKSLADVLAPLYQVLTESRDHAE